MRKPKQPLHTFGTKVWNILFTVFYPFISIFTFLMLFLLSVLAVFSNMLVALARKIKSD